MNIENELNKIIAKHQLNVGYPEWNYFFEAKRLIIKLFTEIPDNTILAIRGAGGHTVRLMEILSAAGLKEKVSYIVDKEVRETELAGVKVIDTSMAQTMQIDCYVISSYRYEEAMYLDLRWADATVDVIRLYQYFRFHNLFLDKEFYAYDKANTYIDSIYIKEQYQKAQTMEEKKKYLEMLIFICVDMRDFVNAFECIKEYRENGFDEQGKYKEAKEALEEFFSDIKRYLLKKQTRDIVINWVDCVPYEDAEKMEFIQKEAEKGIKFTNAYSMVPSTRAAMANIFRGKDIEKGKTREYLHDLLTPENSPLLKLLEKEGYEFYYICGEECKKLTVLFEGKCVSNKEEQFHHFKERQLGCSTRLQWRALYRRCLSETQNCYLIHSLNETHQPNISIGSIGYGWGFNYENDYIRDAKQYRKESQRYIDQQLEFYREFYGKKDVIIYMSDHGVSKKAYSDARHKVFLIISGAIDKTEQEERLYSHLDFYKVIRYVLHMDKRNYDSIFSDQIVLRNYDAYRARFVGYCLDVIKSGAECSIYYQYYGLRTEKYLYVKYFHGIEKFYVLPDMTCNRIEDKEYTEIVEKFRQQVKDKLIDWKTDEMFCVCEPLYEYVDKIDKTKW